MRVLSSLLKILAVVAIAVFLINGLSNPISLPTADLGRHIRNGSYIVNALSHGLDLHSYTPLFNNFYSYTEPLHKCINHHWLSGFIYHWIHQIFYFPGLAWFNILLCFSAVLFSFFSAKKLGSLDSALVSLALALPLLVMRNDVRPESFSYLFLAAEFFLLIKLRKTEINKTFATLMICLIQLIWINSHIFFAMGLMNIAIFALDAYFNKTDSFKTFLKIFITVILISFVNPFTYQALLEPLNIFREYPYMLVENQSIFFMHKRFPASTIYYYFDFYVLLFLVFAFWHFKKSQLSYKEFFKRNLVWVLISAVYMLLAIKVQRAIPVFVLQSVVIFAAVFKDKIALLQKNFVTEFVLVIVLCTQFFAWKVELERYRVNGLGPFMQNSAKFFKEAKLSGPIFNNYDIGGYLIYHLFPYERVFIDNRPESYSREFFKEVYEPMQSSEEKWQQMQEKYGFNVIFFMRRDFTEFAQPFLIKRIADPEWVPVFANFWTIILVKNNEKNADVIAKYKLDDSVFTVSKNR